MTEHDRTCPKCTSVLVTRYVNSDHREIGFECHDCGTIWAELARGLSDPAPSLPDVDPIRGGRLE